MNTVTKLITCLAFTIAGIAFSSSATAQETGVVINGVRWAACNVDEPGTFASSPEQSGMFYQWNRKIGWSSSDPLVNSNGGTTWDSSNPSGTTWASANDPSPSGWRVPTVAELESLFTTNVTNVWTTQNGVNGILFTDKSNGNSMFLPAAGHRYDGGGSLYYVGSNGLYWSSTQYGSYKACYLYFYSSSAGADGNYYYGRYDNFRSLGFSIRPVAE